jgi:hypothetical protein
MICSLTVSFPKIFFSVTIHYFDILVGIEEKIDDIQKYKMDGFKDSYERRTINQEYLRCHSYQFWTT